MAQTLSGHVEERKNHANYTQDKTGYNMIKDIPIQIKDIKRHTKHILKMIIKYG